MIAVDVHDVATAAIVTRYFPAIEAWWVSSLGTSIRLGFPDAYILSPRDYAPLLQALKLTTPSLNTLVDADNGGQSATTVAYAFQLYSALDVSLAFIENKRGAKYNSLDEGPGVIHSLEHDRVFAEKLGAARDAQTRTLVGARLENAIVHRNNPQLGLRKALKTTDYILAQAPPDVILFHWSGPSPEVPFAYADRYHKLVAGTKDPPPLACIPTTYSSSTSHRSLADFGYRIIIYGNLLLRSQFASAIHAVESLIECGSLQHIERELMSVREILDLMDRLRIAHEKDEV